VSEKIQFRYVVNAKLCKNNNLRADLRADASIGACRGANLGNVLAADGELFGRLDSHFDASPGSAQQCDLDGAVGEQLCHGHVGINTIGRLYYDRLIGSSAED
jgi:hypothetical protein